MLELTSVCHLSSSACKKINVAFLKVIDIVSLNCNRCSRKLVNCINGSLHLNGTIQLFHCWIFEIYKASQPAELISHEVHHHNLPTFRNQSSLVQKDQVSQGIQIASCQKDQMKFSIYGFNNTHSWFKGLTWKAE